MGNMVQCLIPPQLLGQSPVNENEDNGSTMGGGSGGGAIGGGYMRQPPTASSYTAFSGDGVRLSSGGGPVSSADANQQMQDAMAQREAALRAAMARYGGGSAPTTL
eukprot:GFYU01004857.1.p1 GENE.GFYU01004857.1~~GFYU01004857.1.p1  ORF type:complete len:106 (-),score=22.01 GFYU01004857.1:364-681(-)